jgi:sugar phosphate permease
MIMSPVANWIILNWGWRVAFLLSGIEILVLVVPVVLLVIRTRPQEMGLEPYVGADGGADAADDSWGFTVKEAFSVPAFWQIAILMMVIGLVTMGVGNHCPAYLTDLGHSETSAAFAWSLVMGAMVLGKLCFGPLADRWSPRVAMIVACGLFAVSIIMLTRAQPYWMVLLFSSVYGFACGAPLVINPLLTSGYLGMRNFGAIYGVLNLMSTVGGAVGPVGTGLFFDSQGTYLPVFYFFFAVMVGLVAVAVVMKSEPRRTGAPEQAEPLGVAT